ncbi:MAG: hypothetical protein IIZ39_11390 [Blautia sp.]|nr:hypothetical protein [Blautia sp.]
MTLVNKGKSSIDIQDINGIIRYNRTILIPGNQESRDCLYKLTGKKSVVPLDNYFGVDKLPFNMTYEMMARIVTKAAKTKSFAEASEMLNKLGYKKISTSLVDQVCEVVGQALINYQKERANIIKMFISNGDKIGPKEIDIHSQIVLVPQRVLIMMVDGHTIYLRKYSTGTHDFDDGGKCGNDCRVGIAFKLSDTNIMPDDAGGEAIHIKHKDITALICPKSDFMYLFADLAIRNGANDCDLIVVVSDGADWLHNMCDELFNSCLHIRDLWHVKECISEFSKALYSDNPDKAQEFCNHLCQLMDEGKIDDFLKKLEPYRELSLTDNGTKLVNPYGYVNSRRDGMEYDIYKKLGLPVGSGAMESTNKTFHRRMRTTGSLWTKSKANRMVMIIATVETGGEEEILDTLLLMQDWLLPIKTMIDAGEIHRKYNKK